MDKLSFDVRSHKVPSLSGQDWERGYYYILFKNGKRFIESNEYFNSPFRAKMAALGHITLIERGE